MSHNATPVNQNTALGAPRGVANNVIISDAQFQIIQYVFYHFLWPSLSLIGLVVNVVNITVFVKIGLHDSVTVSFFILSIVDVCYVFSSGISVGLLIYANTLVAVDRTRALGVYQLGSYVISLSETFFNMSLGITTYVAVVKCCCVARPLTFKFAFTIRRTVAGILLITLAVVVTNIPRYATFGMRWAVRSNTTILEMWFSPEFPSTEAAHKLLNRTIYPNVVLGLVIVCSLILARALRQASKFRRGMAERTLRRSPKHDSLDSTRVVANESERIVGEGGADGDMSRLTDVKAVRPVELMSSKDLQVIKAVAVVTGFLLGEALVVSTIAIAGYTVPGFAPLERYDRLLSTVRFTEVVCIHVTVIVNVGVYFKFNSRFRLLLETMAASLWWKLPRVQ